jgi:hypothetical protein
MVRTVINRKLTNARFRAFVEQCGFLADHTRSISTRCKVRMKSGTTLRQLERFMHLPNGLLDVYYQASSINKSDVEEMLGPAKMRWMKRLRTQAVNAAGVVPKPGEERYVGQYTVLLRSPEELSQVGLEAIPTASGTSHEPVCRVSYVSPEAALLIEGAPGLAVGDYVICCTFGTRTPRTFPPLDLISLTGSTTLRQRIPIGLTVVSSSKVLWGTLTDSDEGLQE